MSNARVKMLKARIGELEQDRAIARARLLDVALGQALVLDLDELGMVERWYMWAEDEGVTTSFDHDLITKIRHTVDNAHTHEVS